VQEQDEARRSVHALRAGGQQEVADRVCSLCAARGGVAFGTHSVVTGIRAGMRRQGALGAAADLAACGARRAWRRTECRRVLSSGGAMRRGAELATGTVLPLFAAGAVGCLRSQPHAAEGAARGAGKGGRDQQQGGGKRGGSGTCMLMRVHVSSLTLSRVLLSCTLPRCPPAARARTTSRKS